MEGYIVQFQANITANKALAQTDDDRPLAKMYKMMYLERYANYFQDPDNMGYAPIILSLGSIDSIRAAVASPVHGIPVVPDYEQCLLRRGLSVDGKDAVHTGQVLFYRCGPFWEVL